MSLQTVTEKIDRILWLVGLIIAGGLWAVAGFPYLTTVAVVGSIFVAFTCALWWTSKRGK